MNKYGKRLIGLSASHLTMRLVSLLNRIARCCAASAAGTPPRANPMLRDPITSDPAPLALGNTAYLYVCHDEDKGSDTFFTNEWLCYSSKDLRHWNADGTGAFTRQ